MPFSVEKASEGNPWMFQSRTLVGLDRKLSKVKRGEHGTSSSQIWAGKSPGRQPGGPSPEPRSPPRGPCPPPIPGPCRVSPRPPRSPGLGAQELTRTWALPHLPDPYLGDDLIPVVGQEGAHVGQEGGGQETVTHQVAQILLQALGGGRGAGRGCKEGPGHWGALALSPPDTGSIKEALCPKPSALRSPTWF